MLKLLAVLIDGHFYAEIRSIVGWVRHTGTEVQEG